MEIFMKHTVPRLAVAVAATLGASQAMATDPTKAQDIVVYIGGSSALDKPLVSVIKEDICNSSLSAIDYLDFTATNNNGTISYAPKSDGWGIACQSDKLGISGNPKVLIIKRSKDGSGFGVNPLAQNIAKKTVSGKTVYTATDPAATVRGTAQPTITSSKCKISDSSMPNAWTCTTASTDWENVIYDGGLSDVDPGMFAGAGINEYSTFPSMTASQVKLLSIKTVVAQVFAPVVNTPLYKALQEAQFGIGNACVGADTQECMPSLTSEQLASIYAGKVKTWSEVSVSGKPLTDPTVTSTADGDSLHRVFIVRRDSGSGTQAVQNAAFLNAPCSQAFGGIAPAFDLLAVKKPDANLYPGAVGSNEATGPVVIEVASTGTSENLYGDLETGSNNSSLNAKANKGWAIGFLGAERNTTKKFGYRYIKVDGVAPTIDNVWAGNYKVWGEATMQWRAALSGWAKKSFLDGANKLAGNANTGANKATVLNKIQLSLANPARLTSLNSAAKQSWGNAGFLLPVSASASLTPAVSAAELATKPVFAYTHATGNASANFCRAATSSKGIAIK